MKCPEPICRTLLASGLIFILLLTGCEKKGDNLPDDVSLENLNFTNYPNVDGSTSAHPLQVLIACEVLGVEYYWAESWFDETYRILPSTEKKPDIAAFIRDSIVHNGTHSAYVNLLTGKADFIIVARTASDDEIRLADSLDVTIRTAEIALDAFVFIANRNNPVGSLTVKQIREIYTGNILNWTDLGGRDAAIHPYQRNPNSGSQELMLSLVMGDLEMMDYPDMILYSMMGPVNQISMDWDGLGYTVYFFVNFMAPSDDLKLLGVNDVLPGKESLKNGDYIYTTKVYAVIRTDLDTNSEAYRLYQWVQTGSGQKIIGKSGYIPVN